MSDRTVTRRLAAILAIDVVGYSRLMRADETDTHKRVSGMLDRTVKPAIDAHKGRIVKMTGDGLLAEFPSAVEGVQAACDIQRTMAGLEPDTPEDQKITFRIGVNLGDIIIDNEDIYGDGVNIAARIEALADPGGVFISRAVADQLSGKLDIGLEDLGGHDVKNIPQPVHVFRVLLNDTHSTQTPMPPSPKMPSGLRTHTWMALAAVVIGVIVAAVWLRPWDSAPTQTELATASPEITAPKPTIAVLPFNNFSDDKDQDYFSDGLTEDLITDISKISGLSVIARNSTFIYKGKTFDVRTVGAELGASHVIEGSVRKAGNTVRITVQLIDASDGTHIWADRYDRELKDIFAIQDEVIGRIISTLSLKLTPEEERRVARHITDNLEAYEIYLKGLREESFFTKEGNFLTQELFKEAIKLDPSFAAAYAHLAQAYSLSLEFNWSDDREKTKELALAAAKKGVELDPDLPIAYWSMGRLLSRSFVGDMHGARAAFEKVVSLDPNYADGKVFLALTEIWFGDAKAAFPLIEESMQINPHAPFWYIQAHAMAHLFTGNYETAVELLLQAVDQNPNVAWLYYYLVAAYGHMGNTDDAGWMMSEMESLGQSATIKNVSNLVPFQDDGYRTFFEEGLRKAGMPEE